MAAMGKALPSVRVLVVDDDKSICDYMETFLTKDGFKVKTLSDPSLAADEVKEGGYHLVVLDLMMPKLDGVAVLERIRKVDSDVAVVIFTGYPSLDSMRQTFKRDVVIDMICYRRSGHNESDEPGFTQPLMYQAIKTHPFCSTVYGDQLKQEGVVTDQAIKAMEERYIALLEEEFEAARSFMPNKADRFDGAWTGLSLPQEAITGRRAAQDRADLDGMSERELADIGLPRASIPSAAHGDWSRGPMI